jgi:hypothetical protein
MFWLWFHKNAASIPKNCSNEKTVAVPPTTIIVVLSHLGISRSLILARVMRQRINISKSELPRKKPLDAFPFRCVKNRVRIALNPHEARMQGWESLSHEQFRADSKRSNQKVQGAVLLALDDQILNGNGVGTNLTGILQTAGIQTQAKGADTMVNGFSLFLCSALQ